MHDPTRRFSSRVENYARYRPAYPAAVYEHLRSAAGLPAGGVVADLGSGTGLSSQLFLARSHRVYAIEPNAPMRAAAERWLAGDPNFVSLAGRAERIPLPDASVDLVIAAQAFHWFEALAARPEMARILRPGAQAALIWNMRAVQHSPFQQAYEQLLLEFGTDFKEVDHQRKLNDDSLAAFFAPHQMQKAAFANVQHFDFAGLQGRLLSSSYAPDPGQPAYEPMLAALAQLFSQYQQAGQVEFAYETSVYHAVLEPEAR
jgi:SAM-dependent methyltransferase